MTSKEANLTLFVACCFSYRRECLEGRSGNGFVALFVCGISSGVWCVNASLFGTVSFLLQGMFPRTVYLHADAKEKPDGIILAWHSKSAICALLVELGMIWWPSQSLCQSPTCFGERPIVPEFALHGRHVSLMLDIALQGASYCLGFGCFRDLARCFRVCLAGLCPAAKRFNGMRIDAVHFSPETFFYFSGCSAGPRFNVG
jgi:hypothetical protein